MERPVFRFAPSPNGRLHLGHALSALLNADLARRFGGRLLLRIEDLDPVRSRPDLIADIETDLAWLGLVFDPVVLRQSHRLALYRAALDALAQRGLAYPCFCSRATIAARVAEKAAWPRDPDGAPVYPGTCRGRPDAEVAARIAAGEAHAWRLDMAAARKAVPWPLSVPAFGLDGTQAHGTAEPERWGDVIIGRRDVPASYHLAVTIDDAAQGVTHVVRGADLEAATDIHVLLQALLGLPVPLYHHHGLVLDAQGDKLAKSRGSQSLADLRAEGWSAQAVRARLGWD